MSKESEEGSLPKVMVVDDDEDVREILGQTLKKISITYNCANRAWKRLPPLRLRHV